MGRSDRSPLAAQCLVYAAFAMPVAMFGAAWPDARGEFDRPASALGVLVGAYGVARLSTSASAMAILARVSARRATATLCLVLAAGALVAGATREFAVLTAALVVVGLATGALDALGNRYQSALRDVASAGLMFGSYGIGAAVGPAVVATTSWTIGFSVAAVVSLVAAAAILVPGLSWPAALGTAATRAAKKARVATGALLLSLSLFALFCGIEVITSSWAATWLTDARGASARTAGLAVSGFWAGMTLGRLLISRLPVRPAHLLLGGASCTLVVLVALPLLPTVAAACAFGVLGLGLAVMFPTLTATTADRVGEDASGRVTGWQLVTAAVSETSLAALVGVLVAGFGAAAPVVLMIPLAVVGLPLVVMATRLHAWQPSSTAELQRDTATQVDAASTAAAPSTPATPSRSP